MPSPASWTAGAVSSAGTRSSGSTSLGSAIRARRPRRGSRPLRCVPEDGRVARGWGTAKARASRRRHPPGRRARVRTDGSDAVHPALHLGPERVQRPHHQALETNRVPPRAHRRRARGRVGIVTIDDGDDADDRDAMPVKRGGDRQRRHRREPARQREPANFATSRRSARRGAAGSPRRRYVLLVRMIASPSTSSGRWRRRRRSRRWRRCRCTPTTRSDVAASDALENVEAKEEGEPRRRPGDERGRRRPRGGSRARGFTQRAPHARDCSR